MNEENISKQRLAVYLSLYFISLIMLVIIL